MRWKMKWDEEIIDNNDGDKDGFSDQASCRKQLKLKNRDDWFSMKRT